MNNGIELRFYSLTSDSPKILQFRQNISPHHPSHGYKWTEWEDVPLVTQSDIDMGG